MSDGPALDIVLVDDHAPSLAAVSIALRRAGHRCFCARSISEAFEVAGVIIPDVVIVERAISEGRGLARRLREAFYRSRLRVIVMSTLDEPDGYREYEMVDEYLVKPFRLRELQKALVS